MNQRQLMGIAMQSPCFRALFCNAASAVDLNSYLSARQSRTSARAFHPLVSQGTKLPSRA